MKSLYLIPFLTVTAAAQFLEYDADRRVTFLNDHQYQRDEYHWFAHNTGQPARLFQNGILISEEPGTNDIRLVEAKAIQPVGCTIGVVDINNSHGQRVKAIAELVSGQPAAITASLRLNPPDIAAGISNLVSGGFRLIVVTATSGYDLDTFAACEYAALSNAVVCCSVPNVALDIDQIPDFPSSKADEISSLLPITALDRNGQLLNPAAWGTNVVGAPGRNIIATTEIDGQTYSSGTSYAAPIVAGCLSLLMARHPNQSSAAYIAAVRGSCSPGPMPRIDALKLLDAPIPRIDRWTVVGLDHWRYTVEYSPDLQTWTSEGDIFSGQSITPRPGFFRLRL